jgi:hypothetical protein
MEGNVGKYAGRGSIISRKRCEKVRYKRRLSLPSVQTCIISLGTDQRVMAGRL